MKLLNLGSTSSQDYLYGSATAEAMGFPVAAEESDIFRQDSAFKLLSSKEPNIRELSQSKLGLAVREATRKPATKLHICTWLNKDEPDTVFARTVDTIWTNARGAGARLDKAVPWDLGDDD